MRKQKINLVFVEWCDAVTYNDGWIDKESVLEWALNDDWVIKQSGFLIEENKKYIILASKYNPQEYTENKFSEITKIPKTWIKKRKTIISFSF